MKNEYYRVDEYFILKSGGTFLRFNNLTYEEKKTFTKGFSFNGWGIEIDNTKNFIIINHIDKLFMYNYYLFDGNNLSDENFIAYDELMSLLERFYSKITGKNSLHFNNFLAGVKNMGKADTLPRVYTRKNSKRVIMVY